jgi:spore coat polysaccharide biosynthesis predicted glycosyltransferase SpsG
MSVLASALRNRGCEVHIFTGADEPIDYGGYAIVVLDSYELSDSYISSLRRRNPGSLLVCYDDNAYYEYDCDVVLNANFHASELEFRTRGKPPVLLLGGHYALLRDEFRDASPIAIKPEARRIFVCFGGSDARGFTPKAVEALRGFGGVALEVVLGAYTDERVDEEVLGMGSELVRVTKAPERISDIMSKCDMAVAAGGVMVYELAALGLPTVTVTQAENQRLSASYLERKGLMRNAGDWSGFDPERLKAEVSALMGDANLRKEASSRLLSAVDKNGAVNAASAILKIYEDRHQGTEESLCAADYKI